jgi:hypothetical protein
MVYKKLPSSDEKESSAVVKSIGYQDQAVQTKKVVLYEWWQYHPTQSTDGDGA